MKSEYWKQFVVFILLIGVLFVFKNCNGTNVVPEVIVSPVKASLEFNETCYLERYPDVGANWVSAGKRALDHWEQFGKSEGRNPGCILSISAPVFESTMIIAAHRNFAYAIYSLVFRGKEYLNSDDHGRELQSASSFDNWGECFNPTEAGASYDGDKTKNGGSFPLKSSASGNTLFTSAEMAFWLRPNQDYTKACTPVRTETFAHNTTILGGHILDKKVTIGYAGIENVIDYNIKFSVPEAHTIGQFEALTGYMPIDFSSFWTYNPSTKDLQILSHDKGEQPLPVIFSTNDKLHAMGVYSPALGLNGGYGRFDHTPENTTKWNCVFREPNIISGGIYNFRCFVIVGTLDEVKTAMEKLYNMNHSVPSTAAACDSSKPEAPIYIVAGQSNATGVGQLNDSLRNMWNNNFQFKFWNSGHERGDVFSWLNGSSILQQVAPTYTFGPELILAYNLQNVSNKSNFYILKIAYSGSSLGPNSGEPENAWLKRGENGLYDRFIRNYNNATTEICSSGKNPVVKGFFWMQGESDALDQVNNDANNYQANLQTFIDQLTVDVKGTYPIFIGQIHSTAWAFLNNNLITTQVQKVRAAQLALNGYRNRVSTFDTSSFSTYNAPCDASNGSYCFIHLDTNGEIALGNRFYQLYSTSPIQ